MKMRQHKRSVVARIFAGTFFNCSWYGQSYWAGAPVEGMAVLDSIPQPELKLPEMEAAKQEFVCQKVKDGSVIDTLDTREAALELVLKHAKQKKAKLQVMDSLTGELVLFSEAEMAG